MDAVGTGSPRGPSAPIRPSGRARLDCRGMAYTKDAAALNELRRRGTGQEEEVPKLPLKGPKPPPKGPPNPKGGSEKDQPATKG